MKHNPKLLMSLIEKLHSLPDEIKEGSPGEEMHESAGERAMEMAHPEMEMSEMHSDKGMPRVGSKIMGKMAHAVEPSGGDLAHEEEPPMASEIKVTKVEQTPMKAKGSMYQPAAEDDYKNHPMFKKLGMKKG